MCGIGCWVHKKKSLEKSELSEFMEGIIHRGPDHQQIIQIGENVLLANNRLAIIDIDTRSNQPFIYKDFALSFNGAIYNYKEIKSDLEQKGHIFITESDTEVILHAYEEFGEDCVSRFNGMWAFVIIDQSEHKAFISRDRFGIKPVYYYLGQSQFIVGSELNQFKSIPHLSLEINTERVQYFLESGGFKNNSESTFYKDVYQLQPGFSLSIDLSLDHFKLHQYYKLEHSTFSEAGVMELIDKSVNDRLIGDVEAGILFSGGLDSSILLSHLIRSRPKVQSYSYIEQSDKNLNEERYIDTFLKKFPHVNHQIVFPENIENLINDCLKNQDEPINSLSVVAQFLLYKLANRNQVKLMISGQGSDEIFAGYNRFLSFFPRKNFLYNPVSFLQFVLDNKSLIADKLFPQKKLQLFENHTFEFPELQTEKEYMLYLLEKNGIRDLLHYEDRNSMSNSIESRMPFLDYRLVEAAYHMPTEIKLMFIKRKGVLLNLYEKILPTEILKRKRKLAFDTPELHLLRNGFFKPEEILEKAIAYFPELKWRKQISFNLERDFMLIWQLYFLCKWKELQ